MSTITVHRLLPLAVLGLLLSAPVAHAQDVFFPTNTTLNATNPVPSPGDAIVGYGNFNDYINGLNPTSPTIAIVTGGSVADTLEVHNQSIINMSGGTVGSFFGKILADDNSTINLSGGEVFGDVNTQSNSLLNFTGGTIDGNIETDDSSTANFSGGTVGNALLINNDSALNWSGGIVNGAVFVQDGSTLDVIGMNLSSTLTDPNFEGFYSEYTLTGSLLDSSNATGRQIFVQNDSGASLVVTNRAASVPEPSSIFSLSLMLTLCGLAAAIRRKTIGRING